MQIFPCELRFIREELGKGGEAWLGSLITEHGVLESLTKKKEPEWFLFIITFIENILLARTRGKCFLCSTLCNT